MADSKVRSWLLDCAVFFTWHFLDAMFWVDALITCIRRVLTAALAYCWGALKKAGQFITGLLGLGP